MSAKSENGIQSFGVVLAIDVTDYCVAFASENAQDLTEQKFPDLLGTELSDLLGTKLAHAIRNAQARPNFATRRVSIGQFDIREKTYAGFASGSGSHVILELEPGPHLIDPSGGILKTLSFLIDQLEKFETRDEMLKQLSTQLRHLSGYDHVMVCDFVSQNNAKIIAEACGYGVDPRLGDTLPSNVLPDEVALLSNPIQCIADVNHSAIPIVAADKEAVDPDISSAHLCTPPDAQLNVLKTIGVRSSLSLSLMVDGALWGMVLFHSPNPQTPPLELRQVLDVFRPVLQLKLSALHLSAKQTLA